MARQAAPRDAAMRSVLRRRGEWLARGVRALPLLFVLFGLW